MMRVLFTSLAERELRDASRYYELEFTGLGAAFRQEVGQAARRIAEYPQAWSIERDHVLIIAVAHQHRKPDYWIDRQNG